MKGYIFPAVGLACVACSIKHIPEEFFLIAAEVCLTLAFISRKSKKKFKGEIQVLHRVTKNGQILEEFFHIYSKTWKTETNKNLRKS